MVLSTVPTTSRSRYSAPAVLAPALSSTRPTQTIVSHRPNSLSFLKPALHDTGTASAETTTHASYHHSCELVERALKATRIFTPTPSTAYIRRTTAERWMSLESALTFPGRLRTPVDELQLSAPNHTFRPHAPPHQTPMSGTGMLHARGVMNMPTWKEMEGSERTAGMTDEDVRACPP